MSQIDHRHAELIRVIIMTKMVKWQSGVGRMRSDYDRMRSDDGRMRCGDDRMRSDDGRMRCGDDGRRRSGDGRMRSDVCEHVHRAKYTDNEQRGTMP